MELPVLVCVSGGPGMSGYLDKYLSSITSAATIVSFVPANPNEHTCMPDLRAELHTQLAEIVSSGRSVVLLAHSFGSVLAIETLREYHARVSGLVLLSWIHNHDFAEFWFREDPKRRELAEAAVLKMSLTSTTVAVQARDCVVALADFYFAPGHEERGKEMLMAAEWNGPLSNPRGPVMQHLREKFDFKHDLKNIDIPMLSLVGQEDQRIPPSYFVPVVDELPHMTHHCIEGAGHFPFLENSEQVLYHLSNFIEQFRSDLH